METEYQLHSKKAMEFIDEFRDLLRMGPLIPSYEVKKYTKQFKDLELNFLRDVIKKRFSLEEKRKMYSILTPIKDALRNYEEGVFYYKIKKSGLK